MSVRDTHTGEEHPWPAVLCDRPWTVGMPNCSAPKTMPVSPCLVLLQNPTQQIPGLEQMLHTLAYVWNESSAWCDVRPSKVPSKVFGEHLGKVVMILS
jgi:hypothetical protein